MTKIANEFNRSSSNDNRKYVFILFKAEKDRSAEQFVVAKHKDIRKAIFILGNTDNKFWSRISLQRSISFNLFFSSKLVLLRN